MSADAVLLVLCTCGTAEEASGIADMLVRERLAACVQIVPVDSVYRWQGSLEHAREHRLEIKTIASRYPELETRVTALHAYDLPEIVTLRLEGSTDYLRWVVEQVS